MARRASLAASHTVQRSAVDGPSSSPQTARTSPEENHMPHAAVLLRDRRAGGGTGRRCQGWPSDHPPRRTHSRAAGMSSPSLTSSPDQPSNVSRRRRSRGRDGAAGSESRWGGTAAMTVALGWALAATRHYGAVSNAMPTRPSTTPSDGGGAPGYSVSNARTWPGSRRPISLGSYTAPSGVPS